MQAHRFESAPTEERALIAPTDYAAGVDAYLADAEREGILHPHQEDIFGDLRDFLAEDGRKGYVTAPTGTGKTVIFVELSKALLAVEDIIGRKPRILVVEPTKDLVHQTLGRTGKKGYGEFAPGLNVASFFSDSTQRDRDIMTEADVVVTTYDSLSIMTRREETRALDEGEREDELVRLVDDVITETDPNTPTWTHQLRLLERNIQDMGRVGTGRKMFDPFDVVIMDEAHHVLGNTTANIVDDIGPEKLVIGFTATPDANEKKRLDNHLPIKIHDLTLKEAIAMELLAPIANTGIRTRTNMQGSDLFDKEGDYQEGKLSHLANSASRNRLITSAAKILVENGFGTIIPCIPGHEAAHAVMIANQLNAMGVTAAAIHGTMPTGKRKAIYREFESGEIDVLTFIRILGEGWDSDRAKAIIEASPTRSPIIKRQRVGRTLRPGNVALVVDLLDNYDSFNPPLHMSDLMDGEDLKSGTIHGTATDPQRQRIEATLEALGHEAELADTIPADYTHLADTLSEYQQIVSGKVGSHKRGHYSIPEKISPLYAGLSDEIMTRLWEMKGRKPDITLGRQGYTIRMLYESGESIQMLRETPECDKDRAFVVDDQQWLSAEGFVIGFRNKYPEVNADIIEDMLSEQGDRVDWRPLKAPVPVSASKTVQYEAFKAYHASEELIGALNDELQKYFQIVDGRTEEST
jgi:superfamily II DNA or RNA helicase